jgi:hypothetical protein
MDTTTMHSHSSGTRAHTSGLRTPATWALAHSRASQRGSTLSMALLLVMSAALVSVVTLQRGLQQWKDQATSSSEKLAFYMAEAGLADAIDDVRSGGSGNIGTSELPAAYGSGAFWVETVTDAHGVVHVTSTGLYDRTAHRLTQAIRKPRLPLGDYGFFGSAGVSVGEDVTIEALDLGGEEAAGSGGQSGGTTPGVRIALPEPPPVAQLGGLNLLGSDGAIELLAGSEVLGSVLAGPDALIDNVYGALVSGSMLPTDVVHALPDIAMPVVSNTAGLTLAQNSSVSLGATTHEYGAIFLNRRSRLTIVGPASLYASTLIVENGAVLALDTTNGPVHLYVDKHLGLRAGSKVTNSSGDASDAVFLVNARGAANHDAVADDEEPVEWFTTQPFVGTLYAPYASVAIPADVSFQGSINALKLSIGDRSHMLFDPRVLDVDLFARDYEFLSWRVLEIPAEEKARLRRDILREARERGDTLPAPAAARIAATDEFRVLGEDGREYTYRGTSLADLTRVVVDAVLPDEVKVSEVPEFDEYEDDSATERGTVEENFKVAYYTMLRYIGDATWRDALETGDLPADVVTAIRTNDTLVEPFRSALSDPSVRADIEAYLASSWLPMNSKRLLQAAIDLYP